MKIITATGSAKSLAEFEKNLSLRLYQPFGIRQTIPLSGDEDESNFLAYIDPGDGDVEEGEHESVAEFLETQNFTVNVHDSIEEATEFVGENFQEEAYSRFADPITAKEIFTRDVLVGFCATSELAMMRGRLDGKPIAVLAHVSQGHGKNDNVVTALALLVDDDLASRLELPFKSSF